MRLSWPETWPIGAQRPRPHAEPRRQGRRHVMQRRAAVAANFLLRALHAQPVPARRTSRTQTLHSPTRQILHGSPRFDSGAGGAAKPNCPRSQRANAGKDGGIVSARGLVCQGKLILLVVVQFQIGRDSNLGRFLGSLRTWAMRSGPVAVVPARQILLLHCAAGGLAAHRDRALGVRWLGGRGLGVGRFCVGSVGRRGGRRCRAGLGLQFR